MVTEYSWLVVINYQNFSRCIDRALEELFHHRYLVQFVLAAGNKRREWWPAGIGDHHLLHACFLSTFDQVEQLRCHVIPETDVRTEYDVEAAEIVYGQLIESLLFPSHCHAVYFCMEIEIGQDIAVGIDTMYTVTELSTAVESQQSPAAADFKHSGAFRQRILPEVVHQKIGRVPELIAMNLGHNSVSLKLSNEGMAGIQYSEAERLTLVSCWHLGLLVGRSRGAGF